MQFFLFVLFVFVCLFRPQDHTTFQHSYSCFFNIVMGIDEYNYYIQYLCLFMFTDGFSHFISVSGVLCLFRCYALCRPPCENSPIKVKKKKTIMVYSVMV